MASSLSELAGAANTVVLALTFGFPVAAGELAVFPGPHALVRLTGFGQSIAGPGNRLGLTDVWPLQQYEVTAHVVNSVGSADWVLEVLASAAFGGANPPQPTSQE